MSSFALAGHRLTFSLGQETHYRRCKNAGGRRSLCCLRAGQRACSAWLRQPAGQDGQMGFELFEPVRVQLDFVEKRSRRSVNLGSLAFDPHS